MNVTWEIREGDALERLRELPDESVHCCVTSPPYFGLRDYGDARQIGLEPTLDEYVARLVEVFREVRRVLRADGTLWLNLGDSYATGTNADRRPTSTSGLHVPASWSNRCQPVRRSPPGCKPKDLLGIPWMVAFALRADGWYLRSDIVWAKPNPMPESVTDRPTRAHEYLFLLSKSARYFYDAEAIREEDAGADHPRNVLHRPEPSGGLMGEHRGIRRAEGRNGTGRNKRSVWTVATRPFSGAHFAVFPPRLIQPCVLAGSSPQACAECAAPWRRVVERTPMLLRAGPGRATAMDASTGSSSRTQVTGTMLAPPVSTTVGWRPTCGHRDGSGASLVLDPFAGSGTTGLVATHRGRSFIGIELNAQYVELARRRIIDDEPLIRSSQESA